MCARQTTLSAFAAAALPSRFGPAVARRSLLLFRALSAVSGSDPELPESGHARQRGERHPLAVGGVLAAVVVGAAQP